MTVAPVGAVGAEATQVISQMSQMLNQSASQQASAPTNVAQAPTVTLDAQLGQSQAPQAPGFSETVLDNVYSQVESLSTKVKDLSPKDSAVDQFKESMTPGLESISPTVDQGVKSTKDEAVKALSKTFDHAIFMAMVNQVVSGVSDTSRTLIRQT